MATIASPIIDAQARERRFYRRMAIFLVVIVLLGFGPSFYLRGIVPEYPRPNPTLPPAVIAHGLFFTLWMAAFVAQTPQFVNAVEEGVVKFGYAGQRTEDVASGITPGDVQWLCRYLGELTDAQLDAALRASGAADAEREQFRPALRDRINQLLRVSGVRS